MSAEIKPLSEGGSQPPQIARGAPVAHAPGTAQPIQAAGTARLLPVIAGLVGILLLLTIIVLVLRASRNRL